MKSMNFFCITAALNMDKLLIIFNFFSTFPFIKNKVNICGKVAAMLFVGDVCCWLGM